MAPLEPRFVVPPYRFAAARALARELGVAPVVAQVLVRRGLSDPEEARAWLAASERHDPARLPGAVAAAELVARRVGEGARVTVHGDYDVDGVCSTAILVGALRRLGARVDWHLPSRFEDGYGLAAHTVSRLAARGTDLLVCVDCGITAVDEVAAARAAGMDVVVCDHHAPRADGALPDALLVHPALGPEPGTPLCAAGVAHKVALALERQAGRPLGAEEDVDLVALATVADCVPLIGENRRLVREGLRALAATARPGLRALMRVARLDPGRLDAHAVSFRLAPRINAAGRLHRADAGLELVLTEDEERARQVAEELDRANAERRDVETRMLFEAEAQVAQAGPRPAYVLAGEGWHPGVVGIVAARIAERHHRPAVLVALDADRGTGSARSIPAYDLLAGLRSCADLLLRHGGHRAAAGLEVARDRLDDLRAGLERHAAAVLTPEDLVPEERVDAVVSGDVLGLSLAEELAALGPFGIGNPPVTLLLPAAHFADPQPVGEGKHVRFTVRAGGLRSRAMAFGAPRLPVDAEVPVDATLRLEVNEFQGAVEPRLVLRHARPCAPGPLTVVGEPAAFVPGALAELDAPLEPAPLPAATREEVDRRGWGMAGVVADVVATGEPVLAVCADVPRRAPALAERLGGFGLCSYAGLRRDPGLSAGAVHVVALDPPAGEHEEALLCAGGEGFTHLAWGPAELRFAHRIHELEYGLRAPLADLYRALRARGRAEGEELEAVLRGDPRTPRSPWLAGRLLRVLEELRLVSLDRDSPALEAVARPRTELERSAAFRAYRQRHEDGHRYLTSPRARAA